MCTVSTAIAIRHETDIRGIQIENMSNSLFADDMVIYLENPKDYQNSLKESPHTVKSQVTKSYKIKTQKFMAFLYINDK